jgi:hypothetical protein
MLRLISDRRLKIIRAMKLINPNRRRLSVVRAFSLVALLCAGLIPPTAQAANSTEVKKLFANPPRQYASAPLWVWNDLLTEQQIRETMRDLAGQKVKQVFVHPRPGLMTPYLSPDWFRLWKVALDEAEQLDMNVWIYDENSYPSGFAGGWVPELMPAARGLGLSLKESRTAPKWSDEVVAVYRLPGAGGGAVENVSAKVKAGEALPNARYVVAGLLHAANSPWHGNRSYVNLLTPGVTEKFLEVTMEAYKREIGAQFGKRVPGMFTDEPNIRPAGGLPWCEDLPQQFQQRWGYSLLDHLPSLTLEVGDWRKVRHNYFSTLNELFIERWAKRCYEWCGRNQLEFTGHYWDHEWPHCVGVPDNMAMYAWHQRPAIDCLMNQYREDTHAQFGNVRFCRELSSVANQLGRARTLVELYGAGGWDLRFEDMKRIADWLQVLGVNTMDEHLSYITLRGARKRDHPQSFSYHEPWWEAYHVSAEYLTRLSCATSQGKQINRVLVLEPTTTAWMYQGNEPKLKEVGDTFFNLLLALEAAQVEYDLGCEDILAREGSVKAKELVLGQRSYRTVVVPPGTENLNRRTRQLMDEVRQGGDLIFTAGLERTDGALQAGAPSVPVITDFSNYCATLAVQLAPTLSKDGFAIQRAAGDKGILFHHRREIEDGQILLLVNTSLEAPAQGLIETRLPGIESWSLQTGEAEPYPFEKGDKVGMTARFNLPACGSLLLFLSKAALQPAPPAAETVAVLAAQGPPQPRRLGPNVLTLDYVDVTAGGETRRNVYFYQANQFAWQKNGMARNPWDSAVQFKDELITKTFPADSGFSATYRFAIAGAVPNDLAIVIERPDLYTITCNGQPVTAKPGDWWLDKAFGRIALAQAAQVGDNTVTLKAAPFTMYHELEPSYLLGNFALRPAEKGFVVAPAQPLQPGKWNEQGHPFYAAGVGYTQTFDVARPGGHYAISLPSWYGSVAKVTVNGQVAGYVTAAPWECDVTKLIKAGANEVEVVVIGTLKNTLGPHHGRQPLGSAWPSMFQNGPKDGPPPGAQYATVGYGLFAPFVLKEVGTK